MLKLDGSKLEGGGQLTRMALCLSAITGKAVKIHSIRAGRGPRSSASSAAAAESKQRSSSGKDKRFGRRQKDTSESQAVPSVGGGLKESHLAALRWLAAQTYADVDGDQVGSTEVIFRPGALRGKYGPGVPEPSSTSRVNGVGTIFDTIQLKNPGSVWLIFQAIYPFMVFGSRVSEPVSTTNEDQNNLGTITNIKSTTDETSNDRHHESDRVLYDLTLVGGTNVPKSMSTEYVQQVFLPVCEKIGLPRVNIETVKSGWTTGPIETGKVNVKIYAPRWSSLSSRPSDNNHLPSALLPGFNLTDRGTITSITITIIASPHLFPPLIDSLTTAISSHPVFTSLHPQPEIQIHSTTDSHSDRRLYILLVAHTSTGIKLGADFLGTGKQPRHTRDEVSLISVGTRGVVDDLMQCINQDSCVDEYMQDQLVAFQALASGVSYVRGCTTADTTSGNGTGIRVGVGNGVDNEETGDRGGSLHTRTVRWVCEQMLDGVKFTPGGKCTLD